MTEANLRRAQEQREMEDRVGKDFVAAPERCERRISGYNDGIVEALQPLDTSVITAGVIDTNHIPKGNGGNTPNQYALPEDAKALQDLIEYREMNFAMGNIFKAAYRKGTKDGVSDEYELNKIVFFAKRELKRIAK